MMVLDPRFWLGLVMAMAMGFVIGTVNAGRQADLRMAKVEKAAADRLALANQETRKTEQAARLALIARDAQHHQEQQDAKNHIDDLTRRVRAGAVRLSVPARCPGQAGSGRDTGPAGGTGDQARAELDPQAGIDLVSIAADGDAAIRQLNVVIDAYEDARRACAGQRLAAGASQ